MRRSDRAASFQSVANDPATNTTPRTVNPARNNGTPPTPATAVRMPVISTKLGTSWLPSSVPEAPKHAQSNIRHRCAARFWSLLRRASQYATWGHTTA